MTALIRAVLVVAVMVPLLGCSAADDAGGECLSAFREANPRAEPPFGASPLDDAIRRCDSVAAWRDAWRRVPAAHHPSDDAERFLRGRCAVADLAPTTLCRDLLGAN